ncbi:MAG: hypothetical protein HQK66_06855 [Desulfamplus sp.]|nr:hypothetical protein [Desulfamplus sp.]
METDAGPVPVVKSDLNGKDIISTVSVRCGIRRHRYTVSPGLYAVGSPDRSSEVLVTGNFKLTFDHLRKALGSVSAWILVLDTKGVNVWCAAGKGTFSTMELVRLIRDGSLEKIVDHRRLILPQLGATGVTAGQVRNESGFRVVYGPVRARDIPLFLQNKRKADKTMRQVTFTFLERLVLTPVELHMAIKPTALAILVLFMLSGIGPGLFSFQGAWERGIISIGALFAGLVSGTLLAPVLLPFIPSRKFALKGIIIGSLFATVSMPFVHGGADSISAMASLFIFIVMVSSYLTMNFTGATPFTSPSGVEKEMKQFLPVQMTGVLVSAILWIYSAF